MLGFPLGILSAAGAGGVPFESDYELIQSYILGSNQTSVTFSSLGDYSATYKHLQIRAAGRTDRAGTVDFAKLTLNGVTSGYSRHYLLGDGSSVSSSAGTGVAFMYGPRFSGNNASANVFGVGVIDILDPFSSTKNKTVRQLTGEATQLWLTSGAYLSTTPVSSIGFAPEIGTNFLTGSRFSLYGIKG
jgi:hypothetical protein